jgi:hypothetical protein
MKGANQQDEQTQFFDRSACRRGVVADHLAGHGRNPGFDKGAQRRARARTLRRRLLLVRSDSALADGRTERHLCATQLLQRNSKVVWACVPPFGRYALGSDQPAFALDINPGNWQFRRGRLDSGGVRKQLISGYKRQLKIRVSVVQFRPGHRRGGFVVVGGQSKYLTV